MTRAMNHPEGRQALPAVCFLTGTLNAFAGAERMTAVIANRLAAAGYPVHVLSLWDRASVFPLDRRVAHDALFTTRPSFRRQYLSTVQGIRRHVRLHGIDVLIEVDTMLTLFTLPATLGLGIRRIAWEHCHFDEDLGRRARRWARWLAARTNAAIVVLTERDRRRWESALRPAVPLCVIANPLPFPYPDAPVPASGPDVRRTVLAVGRLSAVKGFDVLIRAWALLRAANRGNPAAAGWRLVIVGEGEERAALESLADRLELGDSLSMPGASADVESHYRAASIFCLSSRYEGFGMVLIEAMAHGLAVVATDCEAGPRELFAAQPAIGRVPVDDPQALADALARQMCDERVRLDNIAAGRQLALSFAGPAIDRKWHTLLKNSSVAN